MVQVRTLGAQAEWGDLLAELGWIADQAQTLGDWRSHSLALGYGGRVYERGGGVNRIKYSLGIFN